MFLDIVEKMSRLIDTLKTRQRKRSLGYRKSTEFQKTAIEELVVNTVDKTWGFRDTSSPRLLACIPERFQDSDQL